MKTKTKAIRRLNDEARTGQGTNVKLLMTSGIIALGDEAVCSICSGVEQFDGFTEDNDPYGEHDFGSLVIDGKTIFWKIDYYDRSLCYGSDDPAIEAITTRVLTLMLASEY